MRALSVFEVNGYIKKLLQGDVLLSSIEIEGEISNFTHHNSGHMYFNLKDDKSRIRCVMFNHDNSRLSFSPKEGSKVVVAGTISLYERDGNYQVYVKAMKEAGIGDLHLAFERLKEKLFEEGLFDISVKKEIPLFPKTIGVVTSASGAAIRDIISILKRRFPAVNILIYPALVQGEGAAKDIAKGLIVFDNIEAVDLIIFGRGGGSMEELFCFNDEHLARTIFSLKKPTISAVGHESDFTIADYVADLRAATPSAAAELAVYDRINLMQDILALKSLCYRTTRRKLVDSEKRLDGLRRELKLLNPVTQVYDKLQFLDNTYRRLCFTIEKRLMREDKILSALELKLKKYDNSSLLDMGYGIITDENSRLIKSVNDVSINTLLNIKLKDGSLKVAVKNREEYDELRKA